MAWSITYSDGSANHYRFESDGSFVYEPVTPERSSTGMYSGGPPRSGRLAAPVIETLLRQVRALEAEVAMHVADRAKGTGAFTVTDAAGRRSFIIQRGPALSAFDAFARAL